MAPKKTASKATGAPGSTEQYTAELKDLAEQAQKDGSAAGQLAQYFRTFAILALLGIFSNASEMTLSPVYGGIPSSIYHPKVLMAGCFVGWAGNLAMRQMLPMGTTKLLPVVALGIPAVQFFLFPLSEKLGAKFGPIVTEGLTLFPLAVLSAASVADGLEKVQLTKFPNFIADAAPGLGSWGMFKLAEKVAGNYLRAHVGKVFVLTRMGLELALGAVYAVLAPSKYLALVIPALLHTAVWNTHVMTPSATSALNTTMQADHWMLLDRKESLTGYVSVVESLERGFRVMRCDHSLLGGQWTMFQGKKVAEPIYAVFTMLEAIRLVEKPKKLADKDANALVV